MSSQQGGTPTRVAVRGLACDAKIVGTLAGGCRVTLRHRDTGEVLASGLQLGSTGDTERILKQPVNRYDKLYDKPGTALFQTELILQEPTPVEIVVEGPLAYRHAMQRASLTTVLLPGQHVDGDGFVLRLHGYIVELIHPAGAVEFHSGDSVPIVAGVRLLCGCPVESGGVWDADRIEVRAKVEHNGTVIQEGRLAYAGRVNTFEGRFQVPQIQKDYEILQVTITASQPEDGNFGFDRKTCKLKP